MNHLTQTLHNMGALDAAHKAEMLIADSPIDGCCEIRKHRDGDLLRIGEDDRDVLLWMLTHNGILVWQASVNRNAPSRVIVGLIGNAIRSL